MTLEELIARQRFSLNRTTRLGRQADAAEPDAQAVAQYVKFEETLADTTLGLAQFLERRGELRCEFLYEAEKVMRQSIDRLRSAEFAPASQQQSEALTLLIKAREAIRVAFGKSPPSEATRRFDREQAQKLRKPRDDDEQAEMLARMLRQLAEDEEFVYATLGGTPCEEGSPSTTPAAVPSPAGSRETNQQPQPSFAEDNPKPGGSQQQSSSEGSQSPEKSSESAAEGEQGSPGQPSRQEGDSSRQRESQPVDRQQLEQRQREIVLDAYEAQRMMDGLADMTELARSRMARSVQQADETSGALARGDTDAAYRAAGEAGELFRELARHVEGLTASDVAGKIAGARDLSAGLAERQRDLANRLDQQTPGPPSSSGQDGQPSSQPGKGQAREGQADFGRGQGPRDGDAKQPGYERGDEKPGGVSDEFARLAEAARTLQDLLDALARDAELDGELAGKIATAREHAQLGALIRQMESIQERRGGQAGGTSEARELAERLERLAYELSALHGSVVAPRLSRLIALEKQVAMLQDRLGELTSDAEISQWHLDAQQLLQALEQAESGGAAVEALRQSMTDAGWGTTRTGWSWARVLNPLAGHHHYVAPRPYGDNLTLLVEDLQREAQELLLRDLIAAGDEAVPPEYQKLVERYFEVLTQGKR